MSGLVTPKSLGTPFYTITRTFFIISSLFVTLFPKMLMVFTYKTEPNLHTRFLVRPVRSDMKELQSLTVCPMTCAGCKARFTPAIKIVQVTLHCEP